MNSFDDILNDFQKRFGFIPKETNIDFVSTSYSELDKLLGGGIPEGKVIEIAGHSGSGKTRLALELIKIAQQKGKLVTYLDGERKFDPHYAEKNGINLEELTVFTPVNGEMAIDILGRYIKDDLVDFIVIDNVHSLISQDHLDIKISSFTQTVVIGSVLRCLLDVNKDHKTTIICLNQVRDNFKTGEKYRTLFPTIFNHYASIRLMLTRVKTIKLYRKVKSIDIEVHTLKNNYAPLGMAKINIEV